MAKHLSIKNLDISFNKKKVVGNLNGEFVSGEVNLIVGCAGSGKSTLLQTIAGFHKEFSGAVHDDSGVFVTSGNFSLAFQNPETLFFNATVGEEVGFALKMRGQKEEDVVSSSRAWLARWGLDPDVFFNKHPFELSGGEKRRVALAACTVFMPPVILLDEPLAGLDARGQHALADLVKEIASEHIVIVVTHEPEIFLQLDSNILFLRDQCGYWQTGAEFIKAALNKPDFYPLPEWYQAAVSPFKHYSALPVLNAESVRQFIMRIRQDANQL